MTLSENTTTSPPSPPSATAARADQKGTQICTLRERRGVKWLTHLESCTPTGGDADSYQGLIQPKGHLQPTVINIPRRRPRKPITIIPTPISSSNCTPSVLAYVNQQGTQIRTLHDSERRVVEWLTRLESCTPAGGNTVSDQGLMQPKGHLQPTVMNIPRRRFRAPAAARITIPTPISSSACTSSISTPAHETQNHSRTLHDERSGRTLSIHFERIVQELIKGYVRPEGQFLQPPTMKRGGRGKKAFVPVPSHDWMAPDVELNNGQSPGLSRAIGKRRAVTVGWSKQCGPQPKGHLEPTVLNLPRRKRNVCGL
ncbi:hypothetical protein C0989_006158 [Termitomyces sp. Mn162]|nr:hypothetical protein C0989_006158 [Termitomyces sp. Mn162]